MAETITAEVLETQDGPEKIEELTPAVPQVGEEVDAAKDSDEETAEETGKKRLGGWQRKIKKLEEQNEVLIAALGKASPQAQTAVTQEDKAPVKPQRPKQSEFQDWDKLQTALEKYEDDRDKYYEEKLAYELRQVEATKQKKSEQETVANGWAAQVAEAKKTIPDFEEVAFSKDVLMSKAMVDAIVTSELGAKIAYELGQDPDEAARIAKLSPVAAIREIGKIESRIAGKKPVAEEEAAAPTRAPRPPSPVSKARAANTDPSDAEPYKEWLRKREAQLRSK